MQDGGPARSGLDGGGDDRLRRHFVSGPVLGAGGGALGSRMEGRTERGMGGLYGHGGPLDLSGGVHQGSQGHRPDVDGDDQHRGRAGATSRGDTARPVRRCGAADRSRRGMRHVADYNAPAPLGFLPRTARAGQDPATPITRSIRIWPTRSLVRTPRRADDPGPRANTGTIAAVCPRVV